MSTTPTAPIIIHVVSNRSRHYNRREVKLIRRYRRLLRIKYNNHSIPEDKPGFQDDPTKNNPTDDDTNKHKHKWNKNHKHKNKNTAWYDAGLGILVPTEYTDTDTAIQCHTIGYFDQS